MGVSYKNCKINSDSMQFTSSYISESDSYELMLFLLGVYWHVKPDILKMDWKDVNLK